MRHHRRAFFSTANRFIRQNATEIGVALSLPPSGYTTHESLRPAGERLTLEPRVSLFRDPQAKRADADALGQRLRTDRRIASVRFIPREQALEEMKAIQGLAPVIAALGRNPLPDAFVVTT